MNFQNSGTLVEQWLSQGHSLFDSEVDEYHHLEERLGELEAKLAAKLESVNQMAVVLGRTPPVTHHRVAAVLVDAPVKRSASRHAARSMAAKFGFARFGSV